MQSTHMHIICTYFAYARMSIHAHMRIHVCLFVVHSHKFLHKKHCWSSKRHIFMEMKRLQSQICILLKHADQWKLSYFEFSITCKFTDKVPFLWHLFDLKLPKMGRMLKQPFEVPILKRELNVAFLRSILIKKLYLWLCLTQIIHSNGCNFLPIVGSLT